VARSWGVAGAESLGVVSLTLSSVGTVVPVPFFRSSGVDSRDRFRGPSPFSIASSVSPRASSNDRFLLLPCSWAEVAGAESSEGPLLLEESIEVSFSCLRTGRSSVSEGGERTSPLVTAREEIG
jgi:hypothetical protein